MIHSVPPLRIYLLVESRFSGLFPSIPILPDNTHSHFSHSHLSPESVIPINMLIVDKQRPKSLGEMDYHKDISQNLIKMVRSLSRPHLR